MTANRCLWCSPRWEGGPFVLCETCQDLYRERSATMPAEKKGARPPVIGRPSRKDRLASGQCSDCESPRAPHSSRRCEACLERDRLARQARVAAKEAS